MKLVESGTSISCSAVSVHSESKNSLISVYVVVVNGFTEISSCVLIELPFTYQVFI